MLILRTVFRRSTHCGLSDASSTMCCPGWMASSPSSTPRAEGPRSRRSGLLRALLLQAFYSVRSETQLMEQLDYNLLYPWFVGLGIDEPVWVQTVFTKNRDRLLEAEVAHKFLVELL